MESMGDVHLLRKDTRDKIAVCALFGLHYWSDHPEQGRMWAVDDNQQAHVVRWYKSAGYASLQCEGVKETREPIWPYRRNQYVPTTYDMGEKKRVEFAA